MPDTTDLLPDPHKRVDYHLGLVLGEAEFRQDQHHLRSRDDRHQRSLHGYGTVAGLEVRWTEDGQLEVAEGVAVDRWGRTVCVPSTHCLVLDDWLAANADTVRDEAPDGELQLTVELCYRDCPTDLVPLPSEECRTAEESRVSSRVAESFDLRLRAVADEAPDAEGGEAEEGDGSLAEQLAASDDPVATLHAWIADGAGPEAASACADTPPDDGCIVLATVSLTVTDGDTPQVDGDAEIGLAGRRALLSTATLQELVLAMGGGDGTRRLGGLEDVAVDGAQEGQLLGFDGETWTPVDAPAPGDGGPDGGPDGPVGGDLAGELPDPEVVRLRGRPLGDAPPEEGDHLVWDGQAWVPTTPPQPPEPEPAPPAGPTVVAAGTVTVVGEVVGETHGGLEFDREDRGIAFVFDGYEGADSSARWVVHVTARNMDPRRGMIAPPIVVRLLRDRGRIEFDVGQRDVDVESLGFMVSVLDLGEVG